MINMQINICTLFIERHTLLVGHATHTTTVFRFWDSAQLLCSESADRYWCV